MQYIVKYKLHFHTFNKEVDGTVAVENGLSFFDGEKNCAVYNESDAVHYIKSIHKQGDILEGGGATHGPQGRRPTRSA